MIKLNQSTLFQHFQYDSPVLRDRLACETTYCLTSPMKSTASDLLVLLTQWAEGPEQISFVLNIHENKVLVGCMEMTGK